MQRQKLFTFLLLVAGALPANVLGQAGSNDPSFNISDPGYGLGDGPGPISDRVDDVAMQPDGKVVVVGSFSTYNGFVRKKIARINADGTLDTALDPGASTGSGANAGINAVVLQPDGKILIAGEFLSYNGLPRNRIARLHADGTLDTSFDPAAGPDDEVICMALQPDGKVIIGGLLTMCAGATANHIARLNADGTLDPTFDTGTGADDKVNKILLLPNGMIMAAGSFDDYDGHEWHGVARLNSDGSADPAFDPGDGAEYGTVYEMVQQPDGKIILAGSFPEYDGHEGSMARLNSDGSCDTSFSADAAFVVNAVALLPDGRMIVGGDFWIYNGVLVDNLARIHSDGSLDTTFHMGDGPDQGVNTVRILANGKALVGGEFILYDGLGRKGLILVNVDGSIDLTFNPPSGLDDVCYDIEILPDESILLAGRFTQYNNVRNRYFAHLDVDGVLDTTFNPGDIIDNVALALEHQPDGKILLAGGFTQFDGVPRARIARLNSDGSLDTGFDVGSGADNYISDTQLQPDGKVIIGGTFNAFNSVARGKVARLNTDGSVDMSFDPGAGADYEVDRIALRPDGKILIAGWFLNYNGTAAGPIARLNDDGSLDTTFQLADPMMVNTIALTTGDRILVGGHLTGTNFKLFRLLADGGMDPTFTPLAVDGYITDLVVQADEKIVVIGSSIFNFTSSAFISRLLADGTPDPTFFVDPDPGPISIQAIAIDGLGRLIVGGQFTKIGGGGRNRIARLLADSPMHTASIDQGGLEIFPNPSQGQVVLHAPGLELTGVTIIDMAGRIVHREHLPPHTQDDHALDLGALGAGVFFARVLAGQRTFTQLIVLD